ncbi:porin family protein [Hymenobacter sp. BRD67]|uniref:porin family protein n=1 Tax=Hymenobacter sp. BRD67 TaxID=2675877 RepID=UPI0015671BEB|nr:porin family protein [Hymenobacter sp. BRD67]QKG55055.1 PorT family protein [Hymenobacter sp. BRD67]
MNKSIYHHFKLGKILFLPAALLVTPVAAQVRFKVGPQVGLNISTAHFPESTNSSYSYRTGFEAGVVSSFQYQHFAFRPAVLFSQKGYKSHVETTPDPGTLPPSYTDTNTSLNYIAIPLNFAYTSQDDGQGLQVFAGPYVGFLVGGRYHASYNFYTIPRTGELDGKVVAGDNNPGSSDTYSKGTDAGLQGGLGYCYRGLLLQATYSLGLRDIASTVSAYPNGTISGTPYYNRAFQASVSYLFGSKD